MKKKLVILFEILLIVAGFLYYTFWVMIPEYKASLGSSDGFIKSKKYQNMIEVVINQKTDFGIVVDEKGKINRIFFFDSSALFLYNENIENKELEKGIEKIIQILVDDDLLGNGYNCEILRNNDKYYSKFMESWNKELVDNEVSVSLIEEVVSLKDRAKTFGVYDVDSTSTILWNLDLYSKDIINNYLSD